MTAQRRRYMNVKHEPARVPDHRRLLDRIQTLEDAIAYLDEKIKLVEQRQKRLDALWLAIEQ